jgi:dipeptidase E
MLVHANHKDRPDASFENVPKWAAKLPVPLYSIDDETAFKVMDGSVEVGTESQRRRFIALAHHVSPDKSVNG